VTTTGAHVFRALAGEAVHDAVRRRIVPAIAAVSLLSLVVVDSCTSCGTPSIVQNGVPVELPEIAGWTGMVIFAVLSLWVMVLAGVLASDHLRETLADGSASLVLARPVDRATFALSRLAGVLVIVFVTGAVLLGGSTALLHARHGVAIAGAAWGGLACALGAAVVASLSMTATLFLPRICSESSSEASPGASTASVHRWARRSWLRSLPGSRRSRFPRTPWSSPSGSPRGPWPRCPCSSSYFAAATFRADRAPLETSVALAQKSSSNSSTSTPVMGFGA
jgi:hypothetical protein